MTRHPQDVLLSDIFRLKDEPFVCFDDRQIHELLTADPELYLDYVRNELINIANGPSQLEMPSKQIFHDQCIEGDFRVMPCGDLRQWKMDKLISDEQLTDLISLLKSGTPPSRNATRIFIATGTALFDNITIGHLPHTHENHIKEADRNA